MSHNPLQQASLVLSGQSGMQKVCVAYAYACTRCNIVSVACNFGALGLLVDVSIASIPGMHENRCTEQQQLEPKAGNSQL